MRTFAASFIVFVFTLMPFYYVYSSSHNYNTLKMRNYGLRLIVFKEKKLNKILFALKKVTDNYYNKVLVYTAQGINSYNELSEEDKILIETVLSLCY